MLHKLILLLGISFYCVWSESMPMPGSLAQQGSSTPFRTLQEKPGWSIAVGGCIPAENQIINTEFAEIRTKRKWGSLGVGLQHESMDSLYLGRQWHSEATWVGKHAFAKFQGILQQQLWFGSSSYWSSRQRGSLGYRHRSLSGSAAVLHLTGCLFPEFAIQWNLGEYYRMNWMLVKGDMKNWSLTLGQELSVPGNIRIGLGWRFPAQIFSAGISVSLFRMQAETAQFWHPVLPSSQWASGAVQL